MKSVQLGSLTLNAPTSPVLPRFLLSLGSSFVLLAARRPEAPESLALSVWDMRHGVVLAEQTLQIPSAVPGPGSTPADVATTLARLGDDAIGLALSPTVGQGRAISYAASIAVPAQSSLVHVVGRQAATERYLAAAEAPRRIANPLLSASQLAAVDAASDRRARLLVDFEAALTTGGDAADAAFEAWLGEVEVDGAKAELPRAFVGRLVGIAMSAGDDASKPLALGTLRQLLPRGVVSDGDVPNGLLLTALRRSDWVRPSCVEGC